MWQSIGFQTYSSFTPFTAKVLVVGAGGSTEFNDGGGGGGGGKVTYNSGYTISSSSAISVTVGNYVANSDGQSSVFGTITSIGGKKTQGNPTYKGGNSGSGKLGAGDAYGAGGGGGDSANGTIRSHSAPYAGGNGGAGTQVTISGDTGIYYGGGGGSSGPGTGGAGGGANGSTGAGSSAQNGTPNTGGGAGGAVGNGYVGGSGIVIVRYTSATQKATGGNSIYQLGGDWVHVFSATGNSTFTPS